MKKKKVLFLCTGNSCRSQMAGDRFEVFSSGINPTQVNPLKTRHCEGIIAYKPISLYLRAYFLHHAIMLYRL